MFSFTTATKASVAGIALAAAVTLPLVGATAASAVDACFPPTAVSDHYSMVQDTTLSVDAASGTLSNDQSGGCADFVMNGATVVPEGNLIWGFDGSFDFIPAAGFVGTVHYVYRDSSSGGYSEYADIYIDVTAAPAPAPLANPDFYSTPQDTVLSVDVAQGLLANDVSAFEVNYSDDSSGELLLNVGGHFTYYPAPGFVGTKTFSYTMTDGTTTSNLALVTIEVTAAPSSVIPGNPGAPGDPGGTGGADGSDLPTLAYTGADDLTAWLIAPALALVALGGLGVWLARRRSVTD